MEMFLAPLHGVYISQLFRFARVCLNVNNLNNRKLFLTAKLTRLCVYIIKFENQFLNPTTNTQRAESWYQLIALKPPRAYAAVRSKAVDMLLLICCLVCFPFVVGVLWLSLFYCALFCVLSSFAII